LLGVLLAIVLLVLYFRNRRVEEDEDEALERRIRNVATQERNNRNVEGTAVGYEAYEKEPEAWKKRLVWRIAIGVLAVIAIILFILTEDIRLPMVFVDRWTIFHVIIMLVQIVATILAVRKKDITEEDTEEEMEEARKELYLRRELEARRQAANRP